MSLFGGGGMFDIMQQAQQMKGKLAEMKLKLSTLVLTERSEDGLIEVRISGTGTILSVVISEELSTPERHTELQTKVQEVMNKAFEKTKQEAYRQLQEAAGPFASFFNGGMPF